MNLRKLLDPRYGLWIIVPAAFSLTIAIWFLQDAYARDLSLFLNLSTAASTALLGAAIAMWIYRSLTLQSQDRRFRHDLEVRHFEDIYGPLYEDTRQVVEGLKAYGHPWMHEWTNIRERRLGPFVDRRVASAVEELDRELRELTDLSREGRASILRHLVEWIQELGWTTENVARLIGEHLWRSDSFIFDPEVDRPNKDVLDGLERDLKNVVHWISEEDLEPKIEQLYEHAKVLLSSEARVIERAARTRAILRLAESVHAKVLRRMREPFRQE